MPPRERMREIFQMTKAKARDKLDVSGVKCAKNREGELKVLLKYRLDMWKEYTEDLLNRENEWQNDLVSEVNEGPVAQVGVVEVKRAIQKMKKGKAAGPNGVSVEVICDMQM